MGHFERMRSPEQEQFAAFAHLRSLAQCPGRGRCRGTPRQGTRRGEPGGHWWGLEANRRQRIGNATSFSMIPLHLGENGGCEGPYDDSLNWVKCKDKELLISNKVEYLSV